MPFSAMNSFQSPAAMVYRFVEEEREAMERYRRKAVNVDDPALRRIFEKLADLREQQCAELERYLSEHVSRAEITLQINAMFW